MLCFILTIFLIPMQLMSMELLKDVELTYVIIPVQTWCRNVGVYGDLLISLPSYLLNEQVFMCLLMSLNYFSDSLIAFKTLFLTGVGAEGIVFLKLLFKDSRPFWDSELVHSGMFCTLGFGAPCYDCFFTSFSLLYIYMQYRLMYKQMNSKVLNVILIILSIYLFLGNLFSNLYNGRNYIY